MSTASKRVASAIAMSILALAGCAAPAKSITAITGSQAQLKFLYVQGDKQGIIKCAIGPEGALSNCREMSVILDK